MRHPECEGKPATLDPNSAAHRPGISYSEDGKSRRITFVCEVCQKPGENTQTGRHADDGSWTVER